jgi:hypothetical protein
MKNRRDFLKEVCPTVAFAFFGVSFLEACSSDSLEEDTGNGTTPTDNVGSSDNGYTKSGSTYTIDLTHSNFSQLAQVGDWMNGHNLGIPMLFLKISENQINAYTNICPHQGVRTAWDYVSESKKFRCQSSKGGHNNTYPDDCDSFGSDGQILECYDSTFSGDELTVTTS